jgi:hypothetical protein
MSTTKPTPEKTAAPVTKPVAATKTPAVKTPAKAVAKAPVTKTATNKPALIKAKIATTTPKKPEKEKTPKLKMERDSFTMPKAEYAQIYVLKERLVKLGQPAKKSELLRAGLMLLSALNDAELKANMAKIPAIKTGRPKK